MSSPYNRPSPKLGGSSPNPAASMLGKRGLPRPLSLDETDDALTSSDAQPETPLFFAPEDNADNDCGNILLALPANEAISILTFKFSTDTEGTKTILASTLKVPEGKSVVQAQQAYPHFRQHPLIEALEDHVDGLSRKKEDEAMGAVKKAVERKGGEQAIGEGLDEVMKEGVQGIMEEGVEEFMEEGTGMDKVTEEETSVDKVMDERTTKEMADGTKKEGLQGSTQAAGGRAAGKGEGEGPEILSKETFDSLIALLREAQEQWYNQISFELTTVGDAVGFLDGMDALGKKALIKSIQVTKGLVKTRTSISTPSKKMRGSQGAVDFHSPNGTHRAGKDVERIKASAPLGCKVMVRAQTLKKDHAVSEWVSGLVIDPNQMEYE